MAHTQVHESYSVSSKLAKYPFEPYWPEKTLRICITGVERGQIAGDARKAQRSGSVPPVLCRVMVSMRWALGREPGPGPWAVARCQAGPQRRSCPAGAGGFIASHLAKRLKSEGHYIVASDWKRNDHFSVSCAGDTAAASFEATALPPRRGPGPAGSPYSPASLPVPDLPCAAERVGHAGSCLACVGSPQPA
jgi:hypothetical protein